MKTFLDNFCFKKNNPFLRPNIKICCILVVDDLLRKNLRFRRGQLCCKLVNSFVLRLCCCWVISWQYRLIINSVETEIVYLVNLFILQYYISIKTTVKPLSLPKSRRRTLSSIPRTSLVDDCWLSDIMPSFWISCTSFFINIFLIN